VSSARACSRCSRSGPPAPGAPTPPPPPPGPNWEEQHRAALNDASLKKGLKLFWFATGKDDFLVESSRKTVDLFKKHGFEVIYVESGGAHTWLNWRNYLGEFAPRLFR
jgi:enterochelin esterase-like enzyme